MSKRVWISLVSVGVATQTIVSCGEPPFDDLTRPVPGSDAGGAVAVPSGIRAKGGNATKSTGGRAATTSMSRGGAPSSNAAAGGEIGDGGAAIAEAPPSPALGGSGGRAAAATGGRAATGGKAATGGVTATSGGSTPTGGTSEPTDGGGGSGNGGATASGGVAPFPATGGTQAGGHETGGQGTGGSEPAAPSRALWFTEYVEGAAGTRKALEISTLEETTLLGCQIETYSNGATTGPRVTALDASISPQSPWVLCTKELVELPLPACSQQVGLNFNGDDAITLVCEGQLIDSIGQIGALPEPKYWGTPELKTADMVLRRACSVTRGDPIAEDAFDPSLEWEAFAPDALDGLGSHCLE